MFKYDGERYIHRPRAQAQTSALRKELGHGPNAEARPTVRLDPTQAKVHGRARKSGDVSSPKSRVKGKASSLHGPHPTD